VRLPLLLAGWLAGWLQGAGAQDGRWHWRCWPAGAAGWRHCQAAAGPAEHWGSPTVAHGLPPSPPAGTVKVWSTSDGQLKQTLEGPGGSVDWLAWHPKGDVVLAGSEDFTLWMWLAGSGSCMQVGAGARAVLTAVRTLSAVQRSADQGQGQAARAPPCKPRPRLSARLASTAPAQVFSGHSGPVVAGAFTPDGKLVVSAGGEDDCSLRVRLPCRRRRSLPLSPSPPPRRLPAGAPARLAPPAQPACACARADLEPQERRVRGHDAAAPLP
jgi:hypothetical protein